MVHIINLERIFVNAKCLISLISLMLLIPVTSVSAVFYNVSLESPVNNMNITDNTPDMTFRFNGTFATATCELFVDGLGHGEYEVNPWEQQENGNTTNCVGTWYRPCALFLDNDYVTYAQPTTGTSSYVYMNYTISSSYYNTGNLWNVGDFNTHGIGGVNYTIPESCAIGEIQFRVNATHITAPQASNNWSCWNYSSNDWLEIYNLDGPFAGRIYEDEVWWRIKELISNDTSATITANATIPDGKHWWIINCTNTTDVQQSDANWSFYVDTIPPTSSNPIYPSSQAEASSFTIYIDVTDATSTVDTVQADIFGTNRTMTASGSTYSVTITSPYVTENTPYTLNYYFNDTNGHLSNASYVITVDNIAGGTPPSDDGGGISPGLPEFECGGFLVAYYGRIEIGGTPKVLSPPVVVPIINGNQTQNIFVRFDYELQPYCKITNVPDNPVYINAQTSFTFDCRIPEEQINGNVIIFLSEECQQAVPVSLLPDHTFMSNFGDFIRLFLSGDWDSFRITYHSVPIAIIVTIIIVFIAFIIWW